MYIVQTCMYMYIQVWTRFDSHNIYVKVYTADVSCTDDCIHFMKCTDIIELCMYTDVSFWFQICPAGWPVGKVWLLPGVTSFQVQAKWLNQHHPLVFSPPRPPAFPA
jgi:hypothetical protein